jgi:hypothetical protein
MATYLFSLFAPTPSSPAPTSDLKAFVNKQNSSGNTALHWAALNGHMSIAKLLLAQGADASILNFSGHDAVYEAELNDKQDVAEWLLKEALGLEKGIGREGSGEGPSGANGEDEEDVEGFTLQAGEVDDDAGKVADGMKEMDLKDGSPGAGARADAG